MNKIKMKRSSLIVLALSIICFIGLFNGSIQANVYRYELVQSSSLVWINDGVETPLPQTTALPHNSPIKLSLEISNRSGTINANVSIATKEGVGFQEYYPGVLQVNGINATPAEYTTFIKGDTLFSLDSLPRNIVLFLVAKETPKNRIALDVDVYSTEVDNGSKRSIIEHSFPTKFNAPKMHTVKFYDEENKLISRERVVDGDSANLAFIERQGKSLTGYNINKNRQGLMYSGEPIHSSLNLYAVFETQVFKVNYYVEEQLYRTELVEYGKSAPNIKGPKRKRNAFQYWNGNLNYIVEDLNVYAVYERKSPTLSFRKLGVFEGDEDTIFVKKYQIKSSDSMNDNLTYEEKHVNTTVVKNEKKEKNMLFIILCILAILAILANYVYKMKKAKKEQH